MLAPAVDQSVACEELQAASEAASLPDEVIRNAIAEASAGPLTPGRRVALARSIERLSVLAPAMTRSRKREVLEDRVIREPQTVEVALSNEERHIYHQVTQWVIKQASALGSSDTIGRFALITRQRQMASSMKAALRVLNRKFDLDESLFEDFGALGEDEAKESLAIPVSTHFSATGGAMRDSKLEELKRIISMRLSANPAEKFVLFSYFRETLAYLSEELPAVGLRCHVLRGGMGPEKWEALRRFKDEPGPAILLSSEVGSEGIDLQFCSVLFNYDLPWNPMKVEQRIGRIDRLGQQADKIHIVNFVMKETVEDRVLLRLHERIGIFERSIGDIEQILGENVQKLVLDLFRDGLTDEQREQQAELNIQAIAQKSQQIEELEAQASNLVAFTDYILDEVREGRELGRFIEPDALWTFVSEFLRERYPGTRLETVSGEEGVWRLSLSSDAKAQFEHFLRGSPQTRTSRLAEPASTVAVTPHPRWRGRLRPVPEIIDATHPLILWIREAISQEPGSLYPLSAVTLQQSTVAEVEPGAYVFVVDRAGFQGLRKEVKLRYGAVNVENGRRLTAKQAERLVYEAARTGTNIPSLDLEGLTAALAAAAGELADQLLREGDLEDARLTRRKRVIMRPADAGRRRPARSARFRAGGAPVRRGKLGRRRNAARHPLAAQRAGADTRTLRPANPAD